MAKSALIKTVHTDCPICNTFHQVEERARMSSTTIKGEKVFYFVTYEVKTISKEDICSR